MKQLTAVEQAKFYQSILAALIERLDAKKDLADGQRITESEVILRIEALSMLVKMLWQDARGLVEDWEKIK